VAWTKGRGKLGPFKPFPGTWVARADSEMGRVTRTRIFTTVLGGKDIQLQADWQVGESRYQEICLMGVDRAGKQVHFWSFTSDGKRAEGVLADVSDLHPAAVGFEAQMDRGLARQAYWPDAEGTGFHWVVESRTKKGRNRFVDHHDTAG
jgi:hypothetical protein